MPQTLRYSDLKGRTDLIGKRVSSVPSLGHLQLGETGTIVDTMDYSFGVRSATGIYARYSEDTFFILDEEPDTRQFFDDDMKLDEKSIEGLKPNDKIVKNVVLNDVPGSNPLVRAGWMHAPPLDDQYTDVEWKNATMDDLIVSPNGGIVDSVRNWAALQAKSLGWRLKQMPGAPINMQPKTIRDEFAMKAMESLILADSYRITERAKDIAESAFQFADAMLAEREKGKE